MDEEFIRDLGRTLVVVAIVAVVAAIIHLVGGSIKNRLPEKQHVDRFEMVERYDDMSVLVDKETGIGYARFAGEIFPLYDKDGELYRPNGWRDYG